MNKPFMAIAIMVLVIGVLLLAHRPKAATPAPQPASAPNVGSASVTLPADPDIAALETAALAKTAAGSA